MAETAWHTPTIVRASIVLHIAAALSVVAWPAIWPWALACVVADHLLVVGIGLWPRSSWLGPNWTQLPAGARDRNEIAVTIDDGPDPAVTPQVLDILDRHDARATFFCIGRLAALHPDLCRDIVRRGHSIENHSQHHSHTFSVLGPRKLMRELQDSQDSLAAITAQRPAFFRAPAGLRNIFLEPQLARQGLRLAAWSARGFDTRVTDPQRVTTRLVRALRPGAILLLHDGHAARTAAGVPVIVEVLPALLDAAAARGLHPITLRQALA